MNAIIGLSHLALKTDLGGKQRDYLAKIHSAGASLLGIINDILDFSKIEAGKLDIEHTAFRLDDVLERVATIVGQKAAFKKLELVFDVSSMVPQSLIGDPLRLEQVLTNLIGNAVKFTEHGDILLQIVLLESTDGQAVMEFAVQDSGIGMSSEQQQRLFHAFMQADDSTTRRYGGTGLGLTISKRLVELMGGSIKVESAIGLGSTFRFTACFGLDTDALPDAPPQQHRNLRVLIADDNQAARRVLARLCSDLGMLAETACNGTAAVAAVHSAVQAGTPYRWVLLDCMMPGMSDRDAVHALQAVAVPPAIVMMGMVGASEMDNGAIAWLAKPVSAVALARLLGQEAESGDAVVAGIYRGIDLQGLRVLLVEDNLINQQIAAELMGAAKIVVDIADNGRVALDRLGAGRQYDLVLMDLQMPEMDGYAATAAIRANPVWASLPVVAMTAHAMAEERQRCLDSGMNDHLAKPIDPDLLFDTLARWSGSIKRRGKPEQPVLDNVVSLRINGLDTVAALLRVNGNRSFYCRLLQQFATMQDGVASDVAALLADGKLQDAERVVHGTKGVAANIGAVELAQAAAELEKTVRAGLPHVAALERFATAIANVVAAIWQALPEPIAILAEVPPVIDHTLLPCLAKYLEKGNGDAFDYFERHRNELLVQLGEHAAVVERALNDFDLPAALAHLRVAMDGIAS
jgi:two-component system, sensor histidine kinase and response regulator